MNKSINPDSSTLNLTPTEDFTIDFGTDKIYINGEWRDYGDYFYTGEIKAITPDGGPENDYYKGTPDLTQINKPDGGPQAYYDFPEGAITLNDLIEFKNMDFHRGNIFKACWRWGEKTGTTKEYDARKIIYSGCRLLKQLVGVSEMRSTLYKILDDPQFNSKGEENESIPRSPIS